MTKEQLAQGNRIMAIERWARNFDWAVKDTNSHICSDGNNIEIYDENLDEEDWEMIRESMLSAVREISKKYREIFDNM